MEDFRLTSYLLSLEAEALQRAIEKKGSTMEEELQAAMEKLYREFVPQSERDRIDEQIAIEEAEREKDLKGFCIVKLRDKDEEFFFSLDEGANAYTIASNYCHYVSSYVGKYDLSSLAHEFGEAEFLSQKTYESLLGAMSNDDRIRAVIEFDLENDFMRVYDAKENKWKVYDFMDVKLSIDAAENGSNETVVEKTRMFWRTLEEQELDEAPTQGLAMQE